MSLEYIRENYGVPAEIGGKVVYHGGKDESVMMEITGARNQYLRCKILDGTNAGHETLLHPTWDIEYKEQTK